MIKKIFRLGGVFSGLGIIWIRTLWRRNRKTDPAQGLERILVLGHAAIGDCIFLLPALRCLRALFPEARIVFMAPRYPTTEELIPATGLVDEIWEFGAEHAERDKPEICGRIKRGRFDAVVMSHATPARLYLPAILNIPLRVGHCRPLTAPHKGWSSGRYVLWRLRRGLISDEFERRLALNRKVWVAEDAEHTVSRNLRLIQALDVDLPLAADSPPKLLETPEQAGLAEKSMEGIDRSRAVGLHVGSPKSQYGKIWPAEKWALVCRKLSERHGVQIVLVGGPDEEDQAGRFLAALDAPCLNLVGRLGLMETFAVVRRCRLLIGNDTGLSKAAMAMGVPAAVVWGPSDRPGYGVFWDKEKHLEIFRPLLCSPCVSMGLRAEGAGVINFATCGHHACLEELTANEVFSAVSAKYGSFFS